MYHYLIDERVTKNVSTKSIDKIIAWIKASQIAGEITRIQSPQQMIEKAKLLSKFRSNSTIVAIGDDMSLDFVISGTQEAESKTVVGYVPLIKHSPAANMLGVLNWQMACKALLQRKTKGFELISVNSVSCLSSVLLSSAKSDGQLTQSLRVEINSKLKVTTPASFITIINALNEKNTEGYSFIFEISSTSERFLKLKNTTPLLKLNLQQKNLSQKSELLVRLEADEATIVPSSRLLLHDVIPFSNLITVKKAPGQQSIITARDEQIIPI